MNSWYYAQDGRQSGPVTWDAMRSLAATGHLRPGDLVWTETMTDWKPASAVEGLFSAAPPPGGSFNPYHTSASTWISPAGPEAADMDLPEIEPGSMDLGIGACISRAVMLVNRHFATILLVGVVYVAISIAASILLDGLDHALGLKPANFGFHMNGSGIRINSGGMSPGGFSTTSGTTTQDGSPLNQIVQQVLTWFLSLGLTRIGLNLVSGKEATLGMLFGEGGKLLRMIGASLLYGLMVVFGLLLLVVPGIILAVRFGRYQEAIVDRDLGIMEAFHYSFALTRNNGMNLFGFAVLRFLIVIAGALALCVGLIYALPLVWLADLVAYRWLQHGPRVVEDRLWVPPMA